MRCSQEVLGFPKEQYIAWLCYLNLCSLGSTATETAYTPPETLFEAASRRSEAHFKALSAIQQGEHRNTNMKVRPYVDTHQSNV